LVGSNQGSPADFLSVLSMENEHPNHQRDMTIQPHLQEIQMIQSQKKTNEIK